MTNVKNTSFQCLVSLHLAAAFIECKTNLEIYHIRSYSILDEAGELLFVRVLVLLHQVAHVLGYVDTHDVFAMGLGVKLLALRVVSRETLCAIEYIRGNG